MRRFNRWSVPIPSMVSWGARNTRSRRSVPSLSSVARRWRCDNEERGYLWSRRIGVAPLITGLSSTDRFERGINPSGLFDRITTGPIRLCEAVCLLDRSQLEMRLSAVHSVVLASPAEERSPSASLYQLVISPLL